MTAKQRLQLVKENYGIIELIHDPSKQEQLIAVQ